MGHKQDPNTPLQDPNTPLDDAVSKAKETAEKVTQIQAAYTQDPMFFRSPATDYARYNQIILTL